MFHSRPLHVLVLLLFAGGSFLGSCGCSSSQPVLRVAILGTVTDVLGEAGPAARLAGGLPAAFLVGDASSVEELLQRRSDLAATEGRLATVVDCSSLDELARTALTDQLTDPALDDGGPILLDFDGGTAHSLSDGAPGVLLVHLDAEGKVLPEGGSD